jgi:hypothetical protein
MLQTIWISNVEQPTSNRSFPIKTLYHKRPNPNHPSPLRFPLTLLPNPPPDLHQRLPQQILPPLRPIPPRVLLHIPHAPNPIRWTRFDQLPLPRGQQQPPQHLRIVRDHKLVICPLYHNLQLICCSPFVCISLGILQ